MENHVKNNLIEVALQNSIVLRTELAKYIDPLYSIFPYLKTNLGGYHNMKTLKLIFKFGHKKGSKEMENVRNGLIFYFGNSMITQNLGIGRCLYRRLY